MDFVIICHPTGLVEAMAVSESARKYCGDINSSRSNGVRDRICILNEYDQREILDLFRCSVVFF